MIDKIITAIICISGYVIGTYIVKYIKQNL